MNFNKLVAQILSETTELGRAYRQTKSHLYDTWDKDKGHWVTRNVGELDITGIRNKYRQAQDRANQLEKKYANKVPITHVIFWSRLRQRFTPIDLSRAIEFLFSKKDAEISVSITRSWDRSLKPNQEGFNYIKLYGTADNIHEWYPIDAFTEDPKGKSVYSGIKRPENVVKDSKGINIYRQSKEKISRYASWPGYEKKERKLGEHWDEATVSLKDITWTSYSIHKEPETEATRKRYPKLNSSFGDAEYFLYSRRLKRLYPDKLEPEPKPERTTPYPTSATRRLPNGKVEKYEFYPITGNLKSAVDENGDIYNFEDSENVGPNAEDFKDEEFDK